ncbi:MAG TPA: DUF3828 domain-containing protein [Pyrinomonadaceae bacterium]|nr:DUF3828 domain-containing protein [Pyrinomonadaceae bacterium]
MKSLLISVVILLAYAGTSAQAVGPEQAAKDFYKWYLTELNAEREPRRDSKPLMLQKVSARLGRWLYSTAYEEYGADYFLDAQDYEQSWANGVSAAPAVTKGNVSTVRLTLTPKKGVTGWGVRRMTIKLIKENGAWKIDTVNNRKLIY